MNLTSVNRIFQDPAKRRNRRFKTQQCKSMILQISSISANVTVKGGAIRRQLVANKNQSVSRPE